MPALAKFCKHCSGGSISSLFKSRKPSNSGSDQTRRSWRRLFISRSKSTALGDSGDETLSAAGRFFTSSKNKSKAPYLSTMNFSGNFFPSTEKDLSTVSSVSSGGVESEQANTNNFVPVKGDDIESAPALTGVTKTVHVEVASLGPCTDSQTSTSFSKDPA
ncbi:hypothetical protein MMC24_006849 [Lignoscripta atroalba]|nr:hypothetical protein [Lignoscripta atroalba]